MIFAQRLRLVCYLPTRVSTSVIACLSYSLVSIWKFRVETTSGYIQRRIIKLTEDIKTQYDGSVRDCCNSVYQWAYGEDGLDPKKLVKVGKDLDICNVTNIVNKLNMKYEVLNKKKKVKASK